MAITLVDFPAQTIVGLPVDARFEQLSQFVPRAWRQLFAAVEGEVQFVEVSLPPREGQFREIVGFLADGSTPLPPGTVQLALPAGRFLTQTHVGPLEGIAEAFGELYAHAEANGLAANDLKLDFGYDPALSAPPHQLFLGISTPEMDAFLESLSSPVHNEVGAIFIPVSDIAAARDWYCALLGREPTGDILFGHLWVVPMRAGSGLVLDSKDFGGPHDGKPAFHFNSRDLPAAHAKCAALGVDALGPIVDGMFFTFKDPDGNLLMVADVPPSQHSL